MDKRVTRALAAGTVLALPLLSACGASTSPQAAPTTVPTTASAAPPSSTAAAATPSAATPTAATPSPTASTDPAEEKGAVAKATTTFVKAALTIGYPDKHFKDYTSRLKPLMTKDGYKSVASEESENEKDAKGLYDEHARSYPKLRGDVKVTALGAGSATSKVSYQSLIQRQQGGGWTTLKTSKKQTVTVQLLKTDGKWLVDDAK